VNVKIYVEGGGNRNKVLEAQCRRGFKKFFQEAGIPDRSLSVVACGGGHRAYESFRRSHEQARGKYFPILLVDSEAPVTQTDRWKHVRLLNGDGWQRPPGASPDQIHLMVQAMEAWFHADKEALQRYFGEGFHPAALSQRLDIETIPKADLFSGLKRATKDCLKKGEYSKGQHSFEVLARVDPSKVKAASPLHAGGLLTMLDRICAP
jgi:hypothetical protein